MMEDTSISRKRSRSNTPTPSNRIKIVARDGSDLSSRLLDPSRRNAALNELLRCSSVHDSSYVLEDSHVCALTAVVYEIVDWEPDDTTDDSNTPVFHAQTSWTKAPTAQAKAWASHCRERLSYDRSMIDADSMKALEAIVIIVRNLSYASSNHRLLAYSPDLLALLVGFLYEGTWSSSSTGDESSSLSSSNQCLALHALHTLVNLAPYLDLSGQKLLSDKLFFTMKTDDCPAVPNLESFGKVTDGSWGFGGLLLARRFDTKEDVVADVSNRLLLKLTGDVLVQVWSIFPALRKVMTDPKTPRAVVLMALDLLQEFINQARVGLIGDVALELKRSDDLPSVRALLVNLPDALLQRLLDFLYVPRGNTDALEYVDPTHAQVARVAMLKLMTGYESTIDTDVRDRALDLLVPLMELDSPGMAVRMGVYPNGNGPRVRLFEALLPILSRPGVGRAESSMLASQMLRELAQEENTAGFLYVKDRLIELASRDRSIANLVFHHLYAQKRNGSEAGEDSEEEEETI